MHQLKGLSYENKARRFLNRQGLIFIDRNYHCRMGEIDLIMEDADTIVFIEVRYRKSELFGGAMASVTPKKQQRVIKAAQHYLNEKKIGIAMYVSTLSPSLRIRWTGCATHLLSRALNERTPSYS
jgi:putative endonuclease